MRQVLKQLEVLRRDAETKMLGISPTLHQVTAHHEASHAVAAVKLGIRFHEVRISIYQYMAEPGDIIGGLVFTQSFDDVLQASDPANAADRQRIENLMIVVIAGEAGQAFLEQRDCDIRVQSAEADYYIAMKLATWLFPDPADRDAFIKRQMIAASELVSDPLCDSQIDCVANQLTVLLELAYDDVVRWMKIREPATNEAECESGYGEAGGEEIRPQP